MRGSQREPKRLALFCAIPALARGDERAQGLLDALVEYAEAVAPELGSSARLPE